MKEKGFALIFFILVIIFISGVIIGSSLIIKNYYPSLIPQLANIFPIKGFQNLQTNNNPANINPSQTALTQKAEDIPNTNKAANSLVNVFSCHFNKYGKYPSDLDAIDKDCFAANLSPDIEPNNSRYSLGDYFVSNNGSSYSLILTDLAALEVFFITEKGVESRKIPEETVIQSVKNARDATRITDLHNLKDVINITIGGITSPSFKAATLCSSTTNPCYGNSKDKTGWLKVKLSSSISMPTLPIDPINDEKYHYVYCAYKTDWEINVVLESDQYADRMKNDGGDDDSKYEIGSNMNLIDKIPECRY